MGAVGGDGGGRCSRYDAPVIRKFISRLGRHIVVYGWMPIFNTCGRKFYLSHRPDFLNITDPESFRLLRKHWEVGRASNNRGDWTRLFFLISAVRDLERRGVQGAIAELGVYRGASARVLHDLVPGRELYLFDTFEGLDLRDLEPGVPAGLFKCSLDRVRRFVGNDPKVHYCPGYFPQTAAMVPESERFAVVHLDMDLYQPTKAACEFFYPRLEPGGLLIVHDYHSGVWPGVQRALDEFLADKPERPVVIPDKSGTAVVIRCMSPVAGTQAAPTVVPVMAKVGSAG